MIETVKSWLKGKGGAERFKNLNSFDILDYVEKVAIQGEWPLIKRFVKRERRRLINESKRPSYLRVVN